DERNRGQHLGKWRVLRDEQTGWKSFD
ncbi:MAG: hypothetical protein RL329_3085, partial [Bacteroidota bacterium]